MTSIYFINSPIGTVASFYLLFWVVAAGVPYPLEPKLAQADMDVARAWNAMNYIIIWNDIWKSVALLLILYPIIPWLYRTNHVVNFGLKTRDGSKANEDSLRGSGGPNGCSADTGPFDWEITWSYLERLRNKWFAGVFGLTSSGNVIPQVPLGMKPRNFWLCFFCWEWFFANQNMVHRQFNVFGLRPWCQETCKPKQLWRWSYAQISQIKGRIKILSTTEHNEDERWRHDIFIVFQSFSVQFFFKWLMLCEVSALLAGDAFLSEAKTQQLPTHRSPFWSQG